MVVVPLLSGQAYHGPHDFTDIAEGYVPQP